MTDLAQCLAKHELQDYFGSMDLGQQSKHRRKCEIHIAM